MYLISIVVFKPDILLLNKVISRFKSNSFYLSVFDNSDQIDCKNIVQKYNHNYISSKKNIGFGAGHKII